MIYSAQGLVYKHKFRRSAIQKDYFHGYPLTPEKERIEFKKCRKLLFLICIITGAWPQDIYSSRKGVNAYAKLIYYYLAKKVTSAPERVIGKVVGCGPSNVHQLAEKTANFIEMPNEVDLRLDCNIIEFKFQKLCQNVY